MDIGHLTVAGEAVIVPTDNLWGHVTHLAKNPKATLIRGDIIVIADEDLAILGVKEEAAIIEVLVGIAAFMELFEGLDEFDAPIEHHAFRLELGLTS